MASGQKATDGKKEMRNALCLDKHVGDVGDMGLWICQNPIAKMRMLQSV